MGEKVDLNFPHLVVLNEDPQLSHKLKYSLKDLPVYVGRKHGNPSPQITLSGIGIKVNHAIFTYNNGKISLRSNDPEAREYIFINGKKLMGNEGQILETKDKITFGTNTILLYMEKSNGSDIYDVDWEAAQMELQKEIEQNNKKQEVENEKKKQEELNSIKKDLEEKYTKEKLEIEEKLRKQLLDYETKLRDLNQSVEKSKVESERINVENMLKQRLEIIEAEKARRKREVEIKEKNEIMKKENQKKQNEFIHKSDKLEHALYHVVKKQKEMEIYINQLSRNISLDVLLSKNLLDHIDNDKNTMATILIRVRDLFKVLD